MRSTAASTTVSSQPADQPPAAVLPPRPQPARWLVAVLIGLLIVASVLVNLWGVRERGRSAVSLVSGQPGFDLTALPDPTGQLTFAQVLAQPERFTPPVRRRIQPADMWYRLVIANDSAVARRVAIGSDNDYLIEATLYQARGDNPPLVEYTGTRLRWADRALPGVKLAFAADLPPRQHSVFYVRVHDPLKQPSLFYVWNDVAAFQHLSDLYKLEYACYFTLWLGLFVYNAFLYAVLRQRDYLCYLLYLLAIAAFLVTASGVSTLVMGWPRWPLRGLLGIVLLNLTTFTLVRFSRVFLDTPARLPTMDRWLKRSSGFVWATSLAGPLILLPATSSVFQAVVIVANIVTIAVLPICGAYLYFRRSPQAGIYVLAFLPLAVALVATLQASIARMPTARANILPALTAGALELILLALALAWRYRLITDEADRLRNAYLSQLEREVAQQTRALRETNESLAAANRDKDRVFSILGHDLRAPAQMLSGLSRELAAAPGSVPAWERAQLAGEIEEACRAQMELLDNLLLWGRTKSGHAPAIAQAAAADGIVQAATGALAQAARRKGLRLVASVESGMVIRADPQAAETILRNLIGNAIKYTAANGSITVRGTKIGDWAEIVVTDTGVGIAPEQFDQLLARPVQSQDGTGAEKGSGVGLTLCRDLARGSGGDLKISSELSKGTTATLTLPG